MAAPYSARRAGQAEIRFPLKVSPKFPLDRSLRERLATDLRGAIALRGKSGDADALPGDYRDLGVLASIMGVQESGQALDERYARTARRARAVTERVFFAWEESS